MANIYKVSHWGKENESNQKEYFLPEDLQGFRDRHCITAHKSARKFELFAEMRVRDYFYLCDNMFYYCDDKPSLMRIVLLGRVRAEGPVPGVKGDGWFERSYEIITIKNPNVLPEYKYENKHYWEPNGSATIAKVKPEELGCFEKRIFDEYFKMKLSDLGIGACC